jgi:hypothetical protein
MIDCTITEIYGNSPSQEILQQGAEALASAERDSRKIVYHQRNKRAKRAVAFGSLTIILLLCAAAIGYFWLLSRGTISVSDIVQDMSGYIIAGLIAFAFAILGSVFTGSIALKQRFPTEAQTINEQRLQVSKARWDEIEALGLSRKEIKRLRKSK